MNRLTTRFILSVCLLSISSTAQADHLSSKFLFAARLNGAQEVPSVNTTALGVASLTLNSKGDSLCITMTVNGLSGPITGVHIHEGKAGVPGPIAKDLVPYLSGNSLQATLSGAGLSGLAMAKMFAGDYYINVHTAANPSGEIRGQLLLEEDKGMVVPMSGAQEVPANTAIGKGLGFFMLAQHNQKLSFYVVLDSLTGTITGAHLHKAVAGANGPIIQDLMPFLSGNVISGSVDPTAYLPAILSDSVYINVHTNINPGGQVRGQLRFQPQLHFDARLDGGQEVPPVTTTALGLGVFRINYTMDTIWYDILMRELSGPIAAAHIHKGTPGISGPVVVPFPAPSISGHTISGMLPIPAGASSDSLKSMLLEGGLYANVHTAANPGGEIRGQLYRTAREGYTLAMTGSQEVPAVTTPAYGSGMVSIDRDQSNAHFMIAGTNITPTLAHFHHNAAGFNGPVIFDLGSYMANGGIYGYWRDDDATTPFTTAQSNKFRKDSVYVNMHTAANPSGEIRGQAQRSLCTILPVSTGIQSPGGLPQGISVQPNPTSGTSALLTLQLSSPQHAEVQLTDISGRVIWERKMYLAAGPHSITLPINDHASGVYFVRFAGENIRQSLKLVKN